MCGIAGFIQAGLGEQAANDCLTGMLDVVRNRGPDGEGRLIWGPVALGMRRLSIIDIAGGDQPIWNEDRSIAVVFNGEIYNYLELRHSLSGHQFRTQSDTEVLVHLYEEYGETMCNRLRGMFAFCILDTRKRQLFIARDHFGQKPLYYSVHNGTFAFGSELKSLLQLENIPRDLRSAAFLDFIAWMSLPPPDTHFQNIKKLPAASAITVPIDAPGDFSVSKYWQYSLREQATLCDIDIAAARLDAALRDSVNIHLRADVPVGVLLSGGLDSRCIAAYAQELHPGQLSTFSVGFTGGESELNEAAQTAAEIKSRHFELQLSPEDFAGCVERIAWHLDEPIGDAAVFAVLSVCELARKHVKVLLSGEGADELFGGYAPRYSGMLQTMARSDSLRRWRMFLPHGVESMRPSRWQRMLERAHMDPKAEQVRLRREGFPGDVRQTRGLRLDQLNALRVREEQIGAMLFRPQRDRLSELLVFDVDWQLAESLLQKADKMSMAASVELRTPFLDTEVAELAARIPSQLKLPDGGPGKLVLRRCLARKLHEEMDRPKRGFPVPLGNWFTGVLRTMIEDYVFAANAAWRSYLDGALVRRAWEDFLKGQWDGARIFYALWIYEAWRAALQDGFRRCERSLMGSSI